MKSIKIAFIGLIALAMAACGVTASAPPISAGSIATSVEAAPSSAAVRVVAGKVTLEGKRGLIFASNAYQAAAAVVVPLIRARKVTPATVDTIEKLNAQASAFLAGTDRTLTLAQRSAGIFSIADRLLGLVGK